MFRYLVSGSRAPAPPPRSRFAPERDRIVASGPFRRLAGKTQVLAAPLDPLLRTRLTHTLEVTAMARAIATELGLDEALVEAIGLGHDLGHPAFGHAGERALAHVVPGGFHHAAHGVRIVTWLEPTLRLSPEVVDGILKHSKGRGGTVFPRSAPFSKSTPEALVVRAADLFAYACHDLDDAYRLGMLVRTDVPEAIVRVLGRDPDGMRHTFVAHTVEASRRAGEITLDVEAEAALESLRAFLYDRLYESPVVAEQTGRVRDLVEQLWQAAQAGWPRFAEGLNAVGIETTPSGSTPVGFEALGVEPMGRRFVDAFAAMGDRQAIELGRLVRTWKTKIIAAA